MKNRIKNTRGKLERAKTEVFLLAADRLTTRDSSDYESFKEGKKKGGKKK